MNKEINKLGRGIILAVLCLIALTMILPLVFMVLTTFKDIYEYLQNPLALPKQIKFDNYVAMYSGYNILAYFRNSLLVSLASLTLAVIVSLPAAYTFAKLKVRWTKPLYLSILSLMMIPGMVTLIPRYVMYSKLGLIDNLLSLIVSYTIGSLPYTMYLLTANFRGIPNEMVEASKIDGASYLKVILSIVVPMGKPAIITVGIINFVNFWNEVVQAILFINTDELRTMTAVVSNMGGRFVSNMPIIMTGLTLASIPTILVYMIFERYLQAGITMGAIK